jgi:hypothetical protein
MKGFINANQDAQDSGWVVLHLDPDGNAIDSPTANTGPNTEETMRRLQKWVDGRTWLQEALMQEGLAFVTCMTLHCRSRGQEQGAFRDSARDQDVLSVMLDLEPDGHAIVATYPGRELESKRRLRLWAEKAETASEPAAPDDEYRGQAAGSAIEYLHCGPHGEETMQ